MSARQRISKYLSSSSPQWNEDTPLATRGNTRAHTNVSWDLRNNSWLELAVVLEISACRIQ
jgi:hypothetical protein